jgi:RHS repeat-associated protein
VELTSVYDDNSAAPKLTRTTPIESGKSAREVLIMNGVGRITRRELRNQSDTLISGVDTEYDSLGRILKVSNPYVSGTPIFTTWEYDALGRTLKLIPPDGSSGANHAAYSYAGNTVTVTDPSGKQRRSFSDALGRLTRVDEPGGAPGVGSFEVLGSTQVRQECDPPTGDDPFNCWDVHDWGWLSVTVNGFTAYTLYNENTTAEILAADLRAWFNNDPQSPVSAGGTGAVVALTANLSGADTNYTISWDAGSNDPMFGPSYSVGTENLAGGSDSTSVGTLTLERPFATFYTYDALDNLVKVKQGLQERVYAYDDMGRLTQSITPEAGTVNFTYTNSGRVQTRTDARSVVTSYSYDGLLRLKEVSYNVGSSGVPATPTVTYNYGTSATANNIGRLHSMSEATDFSETYSYDVLGRVTQASKVIDSVTYNVGYTYNWASEIETITYPSSRVVTQNFDSVGRLAQIVSGSTAYLTVPSAGYNAASQVTSVTFGNGVEGTFQYNQRHQVSSIRYVEGTTDLLHFSYNYGSSNNGQIQGITDHLNSNRSTTYSYDPLGRLKEAQTNNLTASETWKLVWTYDRYGNRPTQTQTGGTLSTTQPQLTVSPYTNRITTSGYSYDDAGNMTSDSINSYTWDAENRMKQVNPGGTGATYTYLGALRVKKVQGSTTTRYIFSGSKVIAEYVNGSLSKEYVYAGGQLVATLDSSGTPTYHHRDHLSTRIETNSTGGTVRTFGQLPFGESWYETGAASKWKFTTYERDGESGLDYAIHRSHSSRIGRFMSTDPLAGSISLPQSLNRYAYVVNDPVNLTDPLGLEGGWAFLCTINGMGYSGFICEQYLDWMTKAAGNGGGGGGRTGGGGPRKESRKARQLMEQKKCAEFLQTIAQAAILAIAGKESVDELSSYPGGEQDLFKSATGEAILNRSESATIIEDKRTQPVDSDGFKTIARADFSNQSITLYQGYFSKSEKGKAQTLLHEGLHLYWNFSDQQLAAAAGVPSANANQASANFQKELEKHCK